MKRKRRLSLKIWGRLNEAGISEYRFNENRARSRQRNSQSVRRNGKDDARIVISSAWNDWKGRLAGIGELISVKWTTLFKTVSPSQAHYSMTDSRNKDWSAIKSLNAPGFVASWKCSDQQIIERLWWVTRTDDMSWSKKWSSGKRIRYQYWFVRVLIISSGCSKRVVIFVQLIIG
jgi:hypothetical protein